MDDVDIKSVGIFIALLVALYLGYHVASGLQTFVPALPLWVCYFVAIVLTLLAMLWIISGEAHVFYEGIFVWVILASTVGFMVLSAVQMKEYKQQIPLRHQQNARQQQLTHVPNKTS